MRRVPVLRARSPVAGLRRRTLGPLGVLAQSVATTAPAAAMASTPLLVAADAGSGAPWSFAIAAVLAGLVAVCVAVFARRMAAAGSLYSYTAKGLGPGSAFACAVALVVGYGLLVAAALAGAAWYGRALLERLRPGTDGEVAGIVVIVVLAAAVGVCAVRGVRLTGRVMLVVEGLSIGLILVVLVALLVSGPATPSPPPPPLPSGGLGGIVVGVLPALAAFIGFDSATSLGVEARRPFASVPRAVGITAGVAAVLYLVATVVQLEVLGVVPGAGGEPPGTALAGSRDLAWASAVIDAGIVASFSACTLAALNTLVRVLFSLARDGVAPSLLGRTHRRYLTPAAAIGIAVPLLAVPPLVSTALGVAPETMFSALVSVSAIGFLVAYGLVSLAAPRFLARIGELTRGVVVVAAVAVPALVAVGLVAVASSLGSGPMWAVVVGMVVAGIAGWAALRWRRPAALAGIGVYDETTAADVLTGDRR
ncbi:APC family permease [Actinomycetospora atypica]|uniref:APC family permease n=1 Tax=Actinomycetospora atypica TaxID=1290095 RepID=A0ABV9YQ43_9PSEU